MAHPLYGCIAKYERAIRHFKALDDEVAKFLACQPQRSGLDVDTQQGKKIRWIEVDEPPVEIGLVLGDCMHNLRSALDHFAWQCALLKGQPRKECQFPIFLNRDEFFGERKRGRRSGCDMLKEVKVPAAWALIEGVQPYHKADWVRKGTGLAIINSLSNIDKHQVIPSAAAFARTLGHSGRPEVQIHWGPYKGKAVVASAPLTVPDEDMDVEVAPHLVLVVDHPDVPVMLDGMVARVRDACLTAVGTLIAKSLNLGIFPPHVWASPRHGLDPG